MQAEIDRPIEKNKSSVEKNENEQFDKFPASESKTTEKPSLSMSEQLYLKFCISLLNHQITRHKYNSSLICVLTVLEIHKNR